MGKPVFHRDGTVSFDGGVIVGCLREALNGKVWFECWAPRADVQAFDSPGMTRAELRKWLAAHEKAILAPPAESALDEMTRLAQEAGDYGERK